MAMLWPNCSPIRLLESSPMQNKGKILLNHQWDQSHMKADSRFAASQWEMSLQSNAVSHCLGANLESALHLVFCSWSCPFPGKISRIFPSVGTILCVFRACVLSVSISGHALRGWSSVRCYKCLKFITLRPAQNSWFIAEEMYFVESKSLYKGSVKWKVFSCHDVFAKAPDFRCPKPMWNSSKN